MSEKEFKKLKKDLDAAHKEYKECIGKAFFLQEKAYNKVQELSKKYQEEVDARLEASNLSSKDPELYKLLKGLTAYGTRA